MSSFPLGRRAFLAAAAAGSLAAQPDGTPPPGPTGPVRILPDRPTLLMGDEAAITGGVRPGLVSHGCKRLQVRNWSAAGDSFSWQVEAPAAGEYDVTALAKGKGATLLFDCGGRRAEVDSPAGEFASLVNSTGAGYVIITTSHAGHYFPAPVQAIDRILPGRTAGRDLVRDWIEELGAYGIRLMLYYHVGHDDWRQPGGWWQATGWDPKNPRRYLDHWLAITTEVGRRYGRGLAGWFFDDGCIYYPLNPDFRRLTAAAKAGNPDRVVCYNPWVLPRLTDFQDYLCGEGYEFLKSWDGLPADGTGIYTAGPHKGLQAHTNFILESDWPHSRLDTPIPPPRYRRDRFIADMKAGIAHGVVPSVNLEIYQDGGIGEASLEFMAALKREIKG